MSQTILFTASPAGAAVVAAPGANKAIEIRGFHLSGHIKLHSTSLGDINATSSVRDLNGLSIQLAENEALLATGTGNVTAHVYYVVKDV